MRSERSSWRQQLAVGSRRLRQPVCARFGVAVGSIIPAIIQASKLLRVHIEAVVESLVKDVVAINFMVVATGNIPDKHPSVGQGRSHDPDNGS